MGLFSSAHFVGAFVGGVGGGLLYDAFGIVGMLSVLAVITLLAAILMFYMPRSHYATVDIVTSYNDKLAELLTRLGCLPGVFEVSYDNKQGSVSVVIDERVVPHVKIKQYVEQLNS